MDYDSASDVASPSPEFQWSQSCLTIWRTQNSFAARISSSKSSSSFEIRHSNDPNTPRGIHLYIAPASCPAGHREYSKEQTSLNTQMANKETCLSLVAWMLCRWELVDRIQPLDSVDREEQESSIRFQNRKFLRPLSTELFCFTEYHHTTTSEQHHVRVSRCLVIKTDVQDKK